MVDRQRDVLERVDLQRPASIRLAHIVELDDRWSGSRIAHWPAPPNRRKPPPPPGANWPLPPAPPVPPLAMTRPVLMEMTTCSPALSPLVICTMPSDVMPVATLRVCFLPLVSTTTVDAPFVRVMAAVGTWM